MKINSNYYLILIIISLFLLSPSHLSAQNNVNGQITAFRKYPLSGVQIESKKSKQEVFTDSLGHFNIKVNAKDKLHINAEGFYPITLKVEGNDTISVNLIYMDKKTSFDDIVKACYMDAEDLQDAIDFHLDENNNFHTFNTIYDAIQSIHSSIVIDEMSSPIQVFLPQKTMNAGNTPVNALFVVNKMITFDISDIAPFKVKTIKVLSGNEATLLYGTKGVNGVIEIELR